MIVYWVFAALFFIGWLSSTKASLVAYIPIIILSGLLFPMLLGLHCIIQTKEKYDKEID